MARTGMLLRRNVVASGILVMTVAVSALLSGCTPTEPSPSPSSTPSPSASAEPSEPALVPDGSASDNRAYFDAVNASFLAPAPMPGGRPIIDNLVAAGFDRAAMQVTPDQTAIGGAVDSVQFSVRIGDECLVGQTSGSVGYIGTAGPTIDGTSCLVGATRPIDW